MKTTVACVWVRGNVKYGVEYVDKLRAMVRRHLSGDFRFVCLTDKPLQLPRGIEGIEIPNPRPMFGWWSKLQLFSPSHGFSGRMLYLDLDSLIVGSLDPIVDYPSAFALVPPAGNFQPRTAHQVVRRFNSSVMVWNAGEQDRVFLQWTPTVTRRLFGDQDWIGEQCPDADTLPLEWFPRISQLTESGDFVPTSDARVVLVKKPKCEEAARLWPAFREAWAA